MLGDGIGSIVYKRAVRDGEMAAIAPTSGKTSSGTSGTPRQSKPRKPSSIANPAPTANHDMPDEFSVGLD